MRQGCVIKSLVELENEGVIQLGRGVVISKKDLKSKPGNYPVYSSAQLNNGVFGHFGNYMFDEELITWSVDGGGALFHRNKHKFSITNVGGFCRVLKSDILNVRYLFFVLSYLHSTIQFDWVKKAHPSVLRKEYKTIPIPPHSEQLRIVSILDEAFKAIDQAKANTERNLKNARELFDSYLQGVFDNGNWETKKWGELCDFVRGPFGGSLKKGVFKESGYVVYEQKHAIHDHFNQLRYFIDEEKFNEMKRFELFPGDIIMSCSGVTLGRVAVVPEGIPQGVINQALLKLTPKKNVSVHFIKHWLRSNIFQKIIFDYSGGAAIPNVPSAKILKDIKIPVPNLKEQERIVTEIEIVLTESKRLANIYEKKISGLEELKRSILHKAFTGALTNELAVAL